AGRVKAYCGGFIEIHATTPSATWLHPMDSSRSPACSDCVHALVGSPAGEARPTVSTTRAVRPFVRFCEVPGSGDTAPSDPLGHSLAPFCTAGLLVRSCLPEGKALLANRVQVQASVQDR